MERVPVERCVRRDDHDGLRSQRCNPARHLLIGIDRILDAALFATTDRRNDERRMGNRVRCKNGHNASLSSLPCNTLSARRSEAPALRCEQRTFASPQKAP